MHKLRAEGVPKAAMTAGSSALYPLYGALFIVQHNVIMAQMFRNMLKFMGISVMFLLLLYTR